MTIVIPFTPYIKLLAIYFVVLTFCQIMSDSYQKEMDGYGGSITFRLINFLLFVPLFLKGFGLI